VRSGEPVGSRTLARTAGLQLSPASIRNVMSDLEELGFIFAPHTSAGRVPTVRGYRFFIDTLVQYRTLRSSEVQRLRRELDPSLASKELLESASGLLSDVTRLTGLVTLPRRERAELRQIEFLRLSDDRVLTILVMNQQEVQNRIIQLDRPVSPSELEQAANYLNEIFAGRTLQEIRLALLDELERVREDVDRIMRSAIELGEKALGADDAAGEDYVLAGETRLMEYAELSDVEKLRALFEAFAQKREMLHLLEKCITAEGIQIFVGQESGYQILDDCSVITAPYEVDGDVVGVLGVIGPTRMPYERVVPIVDITAKLLGAALNSRS
jgi:heat-inducible transcriptional repressor